MKLRICMLCLLPALAASASDVLKIARFRTDISPELGANICGYAPGQSAVTMHDPLYACGLALDDGDRKALIVSFDLLGLDGFVIRDMRAKCAAAFGTPQEFVFFACTHNHSGPESVRRLNLPDSVNAPYLEMLERRLLESVKSLERAQWHECNVMFNSVSCDENYNRRFVTSDNYASFTPHRRVLAPIADGPADKELGLLFFYDTGRRLGTPGGDCARYVVGDYAAHVLASHSPGIGGRRITADFPGFFRDYIKRETGADAMFLLGAAGDLVPKNDEMGMEAARRTGENLAMGALTAMIDACRNQKRFQIKDARLGASIRTFTAPMRSRYKGKIQHEYDGDAMTLEVQCLAIGDCCFVGMPGEAASEIGSEIKWHSPFRKTWIVNLSTAFAGYISPANAFVQGGYEPKKQPFSCRGGLMLVNTAVDAMFDLRSQMFPQDDSAEDRYPDNLDQPLVCIPGGVKETNFRFKEETILKQGR